MKSLKKLMIVAALALPGTVLAATPVQLYKNPSCGCCEAYAKYLRANGFEVEVVATEAMPEIKKQHDVPAHLASCHTTRVQHYTVEGHVPVESINKLLKERPMITGIAVPGMPAGSPGMGGEKKAPLTVYAITRSAEPMVFATN